MNKQTLKDWQVPMWDRFYWWFLGRLIGKRTVVANVSIVAHSQYPIQDIGRALFLNCHFYGDQECYDHRNDPVVSRMVCDDGMEIVETRRPPSNGATG